MVNERLLTVDQVAQTLGSNPETVRRYLRSGRLRGTRIGGNRLGWRIPESEVQRLIADGFSNGAQPAEGEG